MQPEHLHSKGNKFLNEVVVSAVITWKGVSQPFFIGGNGIKVNGATYLKHPRDDLIPAVEAMYTNKDFTFVQDSFKTIDELKRRICDVWDECATDLPQICKAMKQFSPVWKPLMQKKVAQSKLFLDRH